MAQDVSQASSTEIGLLVSGEKMNDSEKHIPLLVGDYESFASLRPVRCTRARIYLGEVDRALDRPRATRGRHEADAPTLAAAILNLKQLHVLVLGQHVLERDKLGADDERRQRLGAQLCGAVGRQSARRKLKKICENKSQN